MTLFIGDSFFESDNWWINFYNDYQNKACFTSAIGGTKVTQWLNWIPSLVDPFADNVENIVIHLGYNDVNTTGITALQLEMHLEDLFARLHAAYPEANIYYYGIGTSYWFQYSNNTRAKETDNLTKAFAERLDKSCRLKVVEAEDGMIIDKNTVYIAQGGYHMTVDGKRIKLNEEPSVWGVRPAVDKLFESAIKTYKGNLLSVILTGMGKDGANGTIGVKDAGGITISEDKSTCTIYGMPKAAFETGKVDMVMMLDKIGDKITSITKGR